MKPNGWIKKPGVINHFFILVVICWGNPTLAKQATVPDSIETIDLQSLAEARNGFEPFEDAQEDCPTGQCGNDGNSIVVRTGSGYRFQPSSRPSRPLGNGLQFWMSLSGSFLSKWDVHLTLKKDAFEPVYLNSDAPWFLTETKRFAISRTGSRFSILIGDFKVSMGTGAFSGSGWAPITSWSSPTRLHGSKARFSPNVSNATFTSRRGVTGTFDIGNHIQIGIFGSKTSFNASVAPSHNPENDLATSLISDVSGTYAFSTESSLQRRKGLNTASMGGFVNLDADSFEGGLLAESLSLSSAFDLRLPKLQTGLSGFMRKSWGATEIIGETALINNRLAFWTAAVRLNSPSMGQIKLESSQTLSSASWPFGSNNGFITGLISSTNLFYRTRSAKWGIFSIGLGMEKSRNNRTDNSFRKVDFRAYHEWKGPYDFTFRTMVRHASKEDLGPISVKDVVGNPTESSRLEAFANQNMPLRNAATSYIQVVVAQRFSDNLSWKLSPSSIVRSKDSSSLFLLNAGVEFSRPLWKMVVGWVVSNQGGPVNNRIQSYYSDSAISGRFPVSTISGSSSAFSLLFRYGSPKTSVELRFRETARSDVESDHPYDSRQVQIQFSHSM